MSELVTLGGEPLAEEFSLAILCELQHSFVDQTLDFVPQRPTIVCIMSRTIGMIGTPGIWIVAGRKSFGVRMRVYHRNQIHLQNVLQCL